MGRSGEAMCPIDFMKDPPKDFVDEDIGDEPPPYQSGDMFWCNDCSSYTKDFYASSIARYSRLCRPCKTKKRQTRVQTHLSKLRSRLFRAFNRMGIKGHRSVFKTKSSIVSLIKSKGLRVKDVESIVPPKSEADISNLQAYRFVLRSDLELERELRLGEAKVDDDIHRKLL